MDDFFTDLKIAAGRKSIKNSIKDQLKGAKSLLDVHKKAVKAEKIIEDVENDLFIEVNTNVTHIDEDKRDLARHVYRLKEEIDGVFRRICKKNVSDCLAERISPGYDHEDGDRFGGIFPRFCLPVTLRSGAVRCPEGIHQKRSRELENNGSVEVDNGKKRRGVCNVENTCETSQDDTIGDVQNNEAIKDVSSDDNDDVSDVASGDLEEEMDRLKKCFAKQILWIYGNDPLASENMCGQDEWDVHHWGRALNLLKDDKKIAFAEYVMKEMKCETAVQEQMLDFVMTRAPSFYTEYMVEYNRICRSVEAYLRHLVHIRRDKVFLIRSEAELENENNVAAEKEREEVYEPGLEVVTIEPYAPSLPSEYQAYSPGSPESPPPTPPPVPE